MLNTILLVDNDNMVGESLKAALTETTEKDRTIVFWKQYANDAIGLLSGLYCHCLIIDYPLSGSGTLSIDVIKKNEYPRTACHR